MQAVLYAVFVWLLRAVVVKAVVFTAIFAAVLILVPVVISYLGGFVSSGGLNSAFGNLSGGVWFFLDSFNIAYGLPLVISAWVSRFLIRRLPVVG